MILFEVCIRSITFRVTNVNVIGASGGAVAVSRHKMIAAVIQAEYNRVSQMDCTGNQRFQLSIGIRSTEIRCGGNNLEIRIGFTIADECLLCLCPHLYYSFPYFMIKIYNNFVNTS